MSRPNSVCSPVTKQALELRVTEGTILCARVNKVCFIFNCPRLYIRCPCADVTRHTHEDMCPTEAVSGWWWTPILTHQNRHRHWNWHAHGQHQYSPRQLSPDHMGLLLCGLINVSIAFAKLTRLHSVLHRWCTWHFFLKHRGCVCVFGLLTLGVQEQNDSCGIE